MVGLTSIYFVIEYSDYMWIICGLNIMIDVKNQVSIYSKLHGVSFCVIRGSGLLMLFSGCKVSRRVLSLLTLETSGTELRLP